MSTGSDKPGNVPVDEITRDDERHAFVLLVVFLAPILAVGIVGGYGFAVWMSQLLLGLPGQ